MAHVVFSNGFLSWDGVDLSDHCKSISVTYEAAAVDDTMMGDTTQINLGGVKSWSVEVEAASDEAAAELGATLFGDVGTTGVVIVRQDSAIVSATNPNYTGTGLLTRFNPITGSHGELAMSPFTIVSAGALSRATA